MADNCDQQVFGVTALVAIYQAPQAAYDLFDKATVLYEGRQIYFGPASQAKQYFVNLGFECPKNQTDPDFLTSMTSKSSKSMILYLFLWFPNIHIPSFDIEAFDRI